MQSTNGDAQSRRALLRSRLRELASARDSIDSGLLERQLDDLLNDIWADKPAPKDADTSRGQPDDDNRRVVITGIGVVTPLGSGADTFWNGLMEGRSGVRRVSLCDPGDSPSQIAAEVPEFDPRDYMDAKDAKRAPRASVFAVAAAQMALKDASLTIDSENRYEVGALIANGATSPSNLETAARSLTERGFSRLNPSTIIGLLPNMPLCQVTMQFGLMGHSSSIATACSASSQAIGEAAEVIRRGDATIMLAGGTEAPICRLSLASFGAIRALSTRNHDPEAASRPFDAARDGFVLAEGAGVLVLEQLAHARRRGVRIYAEIIGYASTGDAYHITAPHPEGEGEARAMVRALARARICPEQIDYINAHATSTPTGDAVETLAIKRVFGDYAYQVPISATKSMIGHLTTAAGVVEAAATLLALHHGVIPPTINYEHSDPACDLNYVPNRAYPAPIQIAMSNSFAFGGINSVLVFRRHTASN